MPTTDAHNFFTPHRSHRPRRMPAFIIRAGLLIATGFSFLSALPAAPLSRSLTIDFFRDVPSRNLDGLATRSDGRLIAGPVLRDLNGPAFADILWCLEAAPSGRWLVGTGPEARIFEVTLDLPNTSFTAREIADLDDTHVFALRRRPDGALLAGTSPHGEIVLIREGEVAARLTLPADSIYDIRLSSDARFAYIATGNPGRIYELDIATFSTAGPGSGSPADTSSLTAKGVRLLGEIKDRNARRLALVGENLIIGSAPKGNIYTLPRSGGTPFILQENRGAEVAALLPQPDGDFYAALVFSNQQAESRLARPQPARPTASTADAGDSSDDSPPSAEPTATTPPAAAPPSSDGRFPGRSAIVHFRENRLPETIVSRSNLAFYALSRRGDMLLIAGGEQGDVLGYDLSARLSLSFAGTDSAQINQIAVLPSENAKSPPARFLLLRNNAPGFAILDFASSGPREAETKRLDLSSPATLGALRLPRIRNVDPSALDVQIRTTFASDEAEGWSPWRPASLREDGWFAPDTRGRHVKIRLRLPSESTAAELDRAELFFLPQNRRPSLDEFRIAPSGYAFVPAVSPTTPGLPPSTLAQLLGADERPAPRRSLTSSTVFPQPGMQIVTWTLADADDDELRSTFSIRRDGTDEWIDLAVNTADSFVQFDTTHLADGVYFTRLIASEQAPRASAERLTATFETAELVIDQTPPELRDVKVARTADSVLITVAGRDAMSLLVGVEFVFNNGHRAEATQPDDAIRDSRSESFTLRVDPEKTLGATAVEILLYDERGNAVSRRITL